MMQQTRRWWNATDPCRGDRGGTAASGGARWHRPLEIATSAPWSAVLLPPAVPTTSNFFVLGGDSQRSARLLAPVRAVFGVDLPLGLMYAEVGAGSGSGQAPNARS
jgi:hypothetical protein